MKLDPHLPQLPSIGELLEHPRVKSVVARINRSTLAHRAAGFLEELRGTLAERAGRVEIPSVTQLAERLARRLLGEPPASGPIINATGIVVGDAELAPPLADAAAHAMMQVATEYHGRGAAMQRASQAELCRLTGAEAVLVVSSFDGALNIVIASVAAGRELLVSQSDAAGAGIEWRKLAARHGAILQTRSGDVEASKATSTETSPLAAVVRSDQADGLTTAEELAALAKKTGASLIDVAPLAGLLNPNAYGLQSIESMRSRLEAGADLAIADGAGLLGGPTCGVIVGKRALVDAAAGNYLASIAAIDVLSAAALNTTLAIYRDDENGSAAFAIPVWQLLSAPLANLKQRAERLAALIGATSEVAAAEARDLERPWRGDSIGDIAKTWVVAIRPKDGAANSLLSHLRACAYPIAAIAADGEVHLDLRSVFPRWDQQLVTAFEGTESSAR